MADDGDEVGGEIFCYVIQIGRLPNPRARECQHQMTQSREVFALHTVQVHVGVVAEGVQDAEAAQPHAPRAGEQHLVGHQVPRARDEAVGVQRAKRRGDLHQVAPQLLLRARVTHQTILGARRLHVHHLHRHRAWVVVVRKYEGGGVVELFCGKGLPRADEVRVGGNREVLVHDFVRTVYQLRGQDDLPAVNPAKGIGLPVDGRNALNEECADSAISRAGPLLRHG
mmetsp:Transcript_18987/g.33844  ORF Transcript_18987/g.33844 Transcript_18987/m.33844 type:complete len:226 (+) Transcript_18987:565-1242(+)